MNTEEMMNIVTTTKLESRCKNII